MAIFHATGDLFNPAGWVYQEDSDFDTALLPGVGAIGHGVNCKGAMGSGIAPLFKKRWPIMYNRYKDMCDKGYLLPGMVMPYKTEDGAWIFNIASQYHPGPDAQLHYLEAGLRYVQFFMEHVGIEHVGLPRIGAGIGGLTYDDVLGTVAEVFEFGPYVTMVSLEGA